jgi:hypothetical protein
MQVKQPAPQRRAGTRAPSRGALVTLSRTGRARGVVRPEELQRATLRRAALQKGVPRKAEMPRGAFLHAVAPPLRRTARHKPESLKPVAVTPIACTRSGTRRRTGASCANPDALSGRPVVQSVAQPSVDHRRAWCLRASPSWLRPIAPRRRQRGRRRLQGARPSAVRMLKGPDGWAARRSAGPPATPRSMVPSCATSSSEHSSKKAGRDQERESDREERPKKKQELTGRYRQSSRGRGERGRSA